MKQTNKHIELDRYLRPWALMTSEILHRNVVDTIKRWAAGKIYEKESDKGTLEVATKALKTTATWFYCKYRKNDNKKVTSLTPITSIEQAKKLGFKPYKVPEFPQNFDPNEKVGCQHFTYAQLYAAWRDAFEQLLADIDDDYPIVTDIRGFPDYNAWESVDSFGDDIESLLHRTAKLTQEVDAMCVDFYANDNWNNQADPQDYGFHIQDGKITTKVNVKKYFPKK